MPTPKLTPFREALIRINQDLPVLHAGAPAPSHVAVSRADLLFVMDTLTARIDQVNPLPPKTR